MRSSFEADQATLSSKLEYFPIQRATSLYINVMGTLLLRYQRVILVELTYTIYRISHKLIKYQC